MAGTGLLNADMTTVARWLRGMLRWWLDELAAMCPPALQRRMQRNWPVVTYDGRNVIAAPGAGAASRAAVQLPEALALVRFAAMPAMSRHDLTAAVAFAADRLMPLPAGEMVLAIGDGLVPVPGPVSTTGQREIAIAGMSRVVLERVLVALALAGVTPEALQVRAAGQHFDFMPAARSAALIPKKLSPATPWWALVALLLGLNGATLIWRDMDSVAQLQAAVDARQPIAAAAQRAARRMQAGVLVARGQSERRRQHDPLRGLSLVTAALPAEAWVQRWAWDGRHLRIAGYVRGTLDVVRVMRDSHRFVDVRNASSEVQGEIPTGRPFDILITLWEA